MNLKILIILFLLLSQQNQLNYDDLMQQAQIKLSQLVDMLQELNNYKFDYDKVREVTSIVNNATSLINEAIVLHYNGKDNLAKEKLIEANSILDQALAKAQEYLNDVKSYNNNLRIAAFITVPIASFLTSYVSIILYNVFNNRRIKKILNSYVRIRKHETE
jgi:hypothetical protein